MNNHTPELEPIDVSMPQTQCEAMCITDDPPRHRTGKRCPGYAEPGETLCWLHRGAIEAGTRTERAVRAGLSVAEQ